MNLRRGFIQEARTANFKKQRFSRTDTMYRYSGGCGGTRRCQDYSFLDNPAAPRAADGRREFARLETMFCPKRIIGASRL